eukprot:1011372-Pelagomonas_calceolata.AAC.4
MLGSYPNEALLAMIAGRPASELESQEHGGRALVQGNMDLLDALDPFVPYAGPALPTWVNVLHSLLKAPSKQTCSGQFTPCMQNLVVDLLLPVGLCSTYKKHM